MKRLNQIFSDSCSIMVVDEDEYSSKRLYTALTTMGANVSNFGSADDALEIYKRSSPKIVFVGINCGTMSGLRFIEILKIADKDQIVVLMYEKEQSQVVVKALELGVDKFIQKPLKILKLQEMVLDISEHVSSMQQILNKSILLEEYKTATDKAFIVSVTDPEGVITSVNDNFCSVTGYTKEELIGKKHFILLNRETSGEELIDELWNSVKNLKLWHGRLNDLSKNGSEIIFETVITPILDETGSIKELISFMQDVTEFVRVGRELKKREQQQRLRDLMIARKHEEELIKAKDTFLMVFTHELKTPLNSIINFSEHIHKQIEKEDFTSTGFEKKRDRILEEAHIIKENGKDMLDNINNLLDASKLKDGSLKASITTVYLGDLFETLEINLKYSIEKSGVKLFIKCLDNCMIYTDYEKISKILLNLLSNAIKYSNGKIMVTVECSDSGFEIIIEDNGSGIKDTEKAFELFEQGDTDSMKREAKGTGVGLHVVGMMCKLLGIDIELKRSERLGGLCVRLSGSREFKQEINS